MTVVDYTHVDVFAEAAYRGNSLPVFVDPDELTPAQMLQITQELRHFEAIFLSSTPDPSIWQASVFDLFTELPFAGHPIIGAAGVLHRTAGMAGPRTWHFEMPAKAVLVTTQPSPSGYVGVLDQGRPDFLGTMDDLAAVTRAFALDAADLREDLPLEVVSTGLRYLIVPVRAGALDRARVAVDITALVESVGAEFAVLLDESRREVRHWNNDGVIEDVATGSAAGAIGAYRLRHDLTAGGTEFPLHQGRHVGRPSVLTVRPEGTPERVETVFVGGAVAFVGHGSVEIPQ
ncbi:MAG: PhzF family phenazine biosynthesis isomerase [Solirubrobacterales bacterium]|nr:PhzF family phenazine biosynthesis isomerase [Solirubrobacterales bacterium]